MRCDLCDELAAIHVTDHDGDTTLQRSLCAKHGAEYVPGGLTTVNTMQTAKLRSLVAFIRQHDRFTSADEARRVSMEAYTAVPDAEDRSPDELKQLLAALECFERTGKLGDTESTSEGD
jgi:hypothetical protein